MTYLEHFEGLMFNPLEIWFFFTSSVEFVPLSNIAESGQTDFHEIVKGNLL